MDLTDKKLTKIQLKYINEYKRWNEHLHNINHIKVGSFSLVDYDGKLLSQFINDIEKKVPVEHRDKIKINFNLGEYENEVEVEYSREETEEEAQQNIKNALDYANQRIASAKEQKIKRKEYELKELKRLKKKYEKKPV